MIVYGIYKFFFSIHQTNWKVVAATRDKDRFHLFLQPCISRFQQKILIDFLNFEFLAKKISIKSIVLGFIFLNISLYKVYKHSYQTRPSSFFRLLDVMQEQTFTAIY